MVTTEEKRRIHREASRRYYWKKHKKIDKPEPNYAYAEYNYKIVPNSWRTGIKVRDTYLRQDIEAPMIRDLLNGKTLFVDYQIPVGGRDHPFRTLYNYFAARGLKLRVHIYDDVKSNKYRRILMWAEPIKFIPVKKTEEAA